MNLFRRQSLDSRSGLEKGFPLAGPSATLHSARGGREAIEKPPVAKGDSIRSRLGVRQTSAALSGGPDLRPEAIPPKSARGLARSKTCRRLLSARLTIEAAIRPESPWARFRQARGFSLIELMVVLVLMAIMAAMILPEMKGTFEGELLRSTSRQLARALNLAYSRSVTRHQRHQVRLDLQDHRLVVEEHSSGGGTGARFVPVQDMSSAAGKLDPRISIEIHHFQEEPAEGLDLSTTPDSLAGRSAAVGSDIIVFYPDGTADARELILRDRDGFGMALRVNPITARVKFIKQERQ